MKAGLLSVAALSGLVAAQPHNHYQNKHDRRQVVVTDFDIVTETDIVTATAANAVVYVNGNGQPVFTSFVGQPGSYPTETPSSSQSPSPSPPASNPPPTTFVTSGSVAPPPPPPPISSSYVAPAPSNPAPVPSSNPVPASTSATAPIASGSSNGGGSLASGHAISYSPYNSDSTCKTQDQVNTDFQAINGFNVVRIYGTDCNQVSTVLNAARQKGMKVFAGIFTLDQLNPELQTLISAANGNWDDFDTISIGNELVNTGTNTPSEVVAAIGTARATLMAAGYSGNIVTVDTFVAMIANPELCMASDYAAANCHPFFDGGVTAEKAGEFVLGQAQRVSEACGGKNTVITETGWPWQGETNGLAVPSPENQAAAISSLKSSFSSNLVLFSAFNNYWMQNSPGTFGTEQYWGFLGNAPA